PGSSPSRAATLDSGPGLLGRRPRPTTLRDPPLARGSGLSLFPGRGRGGGLTMPDTPTTPGARLRAARLALGLTQVAAAARLGIPQPVLSQAERDEWPLSLD